MLHVEHMKMAFVTVTYAEGRWDWTEHSTPLFRRYFPIEDWLVIDHNGVPSEKEYLLRHNAIVLPDHGKTHGDGMDRALEWCKQHSIDVMIHWEPDCTISGNSWVQNMVIAIERGAHMAGSVCFCGMIQPCPSAWLVDEVKHSFNPTPRGFDATHHLYRDLVDIKSLCSVFKDDATLLYMSLYHWDTGCKNWFEAAIKGCAVMVQGNDFLHHWEGRKRRVSDVIGRAAVIGPLDGI